MQRSFRKFIFSISFFFLFFFLFSFTAFITAVNTSYAVGTGNGGVITPPISDFDDEYNSNTPGTWHGNRDQRQQQFYQDSKNCNCGNNLCEIFSVNVHKRKWSVRAHLGLNDFGSNGGSGGYGGGYGNYGGGGGGGYYGNDNCGKNPSVPTHDGCYGNYYNGSSTLSGLYNPMVFSAGISVTWEDVNCTKTINVDKAIYGAITTYMRSLVNADGTTRPAFTPAEQTMILFYSTIMKLTNGFACD
ncbi:MAG: hypothetical protein HQK49_11435 [Oligoflexia bacterium]|nr:hypothetical protein [Oligoflexia bacterium]